MAKARIYPLDHQFVKKNYPVVHKIFKDRPGYTKFRQMGLKLKAKARENEETKKG